MDIAGPSPQDVIARWAAPPRSDHGDGYSVTWTGAPSHLGLGHPTATSSAGSASPSFSSAVGFAGSTSSTMSSPARALTASGPGRGRAPHGQVAFYSTLNEARNLVETPRMEAQRFGLGVNGVLLREWSSPSMDRNAGGRPPERIDRRPLRCVTSSSSARMRAAARPRSASSSGPAEIEGATTGAGPDSPGVHVPSVWPLTLSLIGSRRRANVFRNSELARASMYRTIPASTSWYQGATCSAHPRGPVGPVCRHARRGRRLGLSRVCLGEAPAHPASDDPRA